MTTTPATIRPRSPWARVAAVALALVWVVIAFAAVMFFGVASPVGGWFYALLCFLPGLLGAARLAGVRRWPHTFVVATAVALVLGVWAYTVAPPGHDRLRDAAEGAGLAEVGWDRLGVDERGNTWCFKGCPEVTYFYAADASPDRAVAALDAVLEDHDWSGGAEDRAYGGPPSEYDPEARGSWRSGRWRADLRVPATAHRFGWSQEVTARGLTPVEVTVTAAG
jgi:hypothetical protein